MTRVTLGLLALLALAVVVASPVAQLAVAESDSMEPAIPEHAVYLVDTSDPTVAVGDVVLFEQPRSGRLVTHRVVDETDAGYVTQGDANDATDQETGTPPIPDANVVGVVPEVGGHLLVVPFSGLLVGLAAEQPILMAFAAWLLLLAGYVLTGEGRVLRTKKTRNLAPDRVRVGDVILPVAVLAFLATVAILTIGVAHPVTATGATLSDDGDVTHQEAFLVERPPLPHTTLVDVPGDRFHVTDYTVEPSQELDGHSRVTATIETRATDRGSPSLDGSNVEKPGQDVVTVHHVPPVLPGSVLLAMYRVHPLVAAFGTTVAVFVPVVFLGKLLIDMDAYIRLYPMRRVA